MKYNITKNANKFYLYIPKEKKKKLLQQRIVAISNFEMVIFATLIASVLKFAISCKLKKKNSKNAS